MTALLIIQNGFVLAGAFFVNAGVLFYLYLAGVSVPLLGTRFVEILQFSGVRSIIHAMLFVIFFISVSFGIGKGNRLGDWNEIGVL